MKITVVFQRLEAFTIFLASIYFYHLLHLNFVLFVVFLLSIDVFMVGYLISDKVGAYAYNIGHSFIAPSVLLMIGTATEYRIGVGLSLIWIAHIGMDRVLGYGLKLTTGFNDTHLGHIGKL